MKTLCSRLLFFTLGVFLVIVPICAQNETSTVVSINYSDFASNIYPNLKENRPFVILFGSNYCPYSRKQLDLLKNIATHTNAHDYVNFYCINADIDENYDWLQRLFIQNEPEERGVPTWAFSPGKTDISEELDDVLYIIVGNLTYDDILEELEDCINDKAYGDLEDFLNGLANEPSK